MKKRKCRELGIVSIDKTFPEDISEVTLLSEIDKLNYDPAVHGILVQQPLPKQISTHNIISAVLPEKDVDGFNPVNMGRLALGDLSGFIPCTPLGIQTLLNFYNIPISGQHVVIVGRSNIVGKPLAILLMQKDPSANATVTIAHSGTRNLKEITRSADILIAAIGKPLFITEDMVKKGAAVVDVGINKVGSKMVGDVDYAAIHKIASAITPVPGGVGPMTIAMLMLNTLKSVLKKID